MRSLPALAAVSLLVAACQADQSLGPQHKAAGKPSFVTGCTDQGPTQVGCPVSFSLSEWTDNMADEIGTASGAEPLWTGQTDLSSFGPYSCPEQIKLARNKVYIPEFGEDAVFLVTDLNKISNDGFSQNGSPMATYAVGSFRTFSSVVPLGKYTMKGGFMKARCNVVTVRSGVGFKVVLGPITWYDYEGEIDLADNSASGGSATRGWADSESGNVTGVGDGAVQQVVDGYISGGLCTVGWEIWVDGVEKCDAQGNHM